MTLPTGWTIVELRNCADAIQYGLTCTSSATGAGYRYIRITDIQDRAVDWGNVPFADEVESKAAPYEVFADDILFARTGATVGKSYHVKSVPVRSVYASYLIRVRCTQTVLEPSFASWFFQSPIYWQQIFDGAEGTGQPNFNGSKLAALRLPLPPLAEQRRIVARLDTLTARLALARTELDRVVMLASSSRSAAISKLLTKMNVYDGVPLGETVAAIFDGPFGSNLKSSDYTAEGARVVRLENIGRFRFIGEKRTYVSLQKYAGLTRHTLKADDILFSSFVDEQIRVCRFPATINEPTINKADCFAIRVDPARFNPRLLTFVLGATETYGTLQAHVHGATRPRVNIGILKGLVINLPPIAVQNKLADEVETAFARADRLEAEAARACALLDRLEAAILARAFRGELVPQEPGDERASVLLDRIRTERAAAPTARRGRRAKEAA